MSDIISLSKNKNFIPTSLNNIQKYGIDKWLDDFYMPLHPLEYQKIYDCILDSYLNSLPSEKNEIYWLLCACYKVTLHLSYRIFYELFYLQIGETLKSQDSTPPNWNFLDYPETNCNGTDIKIKEFFRNIKVNYTFGSLANCISFNKIMPNKVYLLGDKNDPLIANYLQEKNTSVICIRPTLFIRNSYKKITKQQEAEITRTVKIFFDSLVSRYPEIKKIFSNNLSDNLTSYLCARLAEINSITKLLCVSKAESELLICPLGNTIYRLFAAAWRLHNVGDITAFSHGYEYINFNNYDFINGAHSLITKYITYCNGVSLAYENIKKRFCHEFVSQAKLITLKFSFLERKYNEVSSFKVSSGNRKKKILISGYCMDYLLYPGWRSLNTLTYCHLEIRIIKILNQNGYDVIYKAHPDTISETEQLYSSLPVKYVKEDFYSVYHMADCLLFTYPCTSTFGFSLLTNIPIVLISEKLESWDMEILSALNKRCVLLTFDLDEKGRAQFDSRSILEAIEIAPTRLDQDILQRLIFAK